MAMGMEMGMEIERWRWRWRRRWRSGDGDGDDGGYVSAAPRKLRVLNGALRRILDHIMTKRLDEVLMIELEVMDVADRLQLKDEDINSHTGHRYDASLNIFKQGHEV